MTRAQIKQRIDQLLGLSLGDSVYGDDFAKNNAINRVTDEFAGPGMDCYWATETASLVDADDGGATAAQARGEYCAPTMYKIMGAYWLDSASEWQVLKPTTPQNLDRMYPDWRNADASDTLEYIAFEGVNEVILYPKPGFTRSSALKFEGFAQTNASGISTWAADSASCPLPTWCHDAIALGAAVDMCMSLLASDNDREVKRAQTVLPLLTGRYREARGRAEKAACEHYDRSIRQSLASAWRGWRYG